MSSKFVSKLGLYVIEAAGASITGCSSDKARSSSKLTFFNASSREFVGSILFWVVLSPTMHYKKIPNCHVWKHGLRTEGCVYWIGYGLMACVLCSKRVKKGKIILKMQNNTKKIRSEVYWSCKFIDFISYSTRCSILWYNVILPDDSSEGKNPRFQRRSISNISTFLAKTSSLEFIRSSAATSEQSRLIKTRVNTLVRKWNTIGLLTYLCLQTKKTTYFKRNS